MHEVDGIRLEEFRRFKEEIRGSEEYLIVGIDIAKESHIAFFGTANGKTLLRRLVFDNTIEGFRKFLEQTEAIKSEHSLGKVVFGLEPTANYHKPLAEHLIKCGFMVVLVSGASAKKNRSLLDGRWDKHDAKDAANVADLISQGKCMYYEYPDNAIRDLRSLLSLKRRLKKNEVISCTRIRNNLLAQYFPEMDRHFGLPESMAVVRRCLDPSLIAGMEYDEFCQLITTRKMTLPRELRVREIWRAAPGSIGCRVGAAVEFEARVMIDGLKQIRETLRSVEEKIEEICLPFPEYSYLLSMPGFGPNLSSMVLGAIGNPHRFTSGKQVLKMAGYDLCADRSGKTSNSATPVISKQGKAELRHALYQAAMVASIKSKDFIVYYTNKLKGREREKGIGTKMRVKLAAKMLIIAWTLMKKGEFFNPDYLNKG